MRPLLQCGILLTQAFTQLIGYQTVGLTVEPELVEGRYCLGNRGSVIFRATVKFTYHNTSQNRILVPRFYQVAGFTVFRDEESLGANRPDTQSRYVMDRQLDVMNLDQAAPDDRLFDVLEPAASNARILEIFLAVRPRPEVPLGADHFVRVEISHWSKNFKAAENLRRRWRKFGVLWIDNVVSQPLKLHIEKDFVPQRCQDRID